MLEPRYFQRDALDSLYAYWEKEDSGNGLIVVPTGGGKAYIIALLIMELLEKYPGLRIINLTHSSKLVAQNFAEFIALSPFAPAGIYSAGLGRRDRAQILFAGIQSVWNKLDVLGAFDLVILDEAHAISRDQDTRYGKFFTRLDELTAEEEGGYRLVGLTATDYRMDSGRLTEGEGAMFDEVVYEIGIGKLIEEGYLTRLTSQKTTSKIDLRGIRTVAGEYNQGQLADAAEKIIEAAIAEDMESSHDRNAALFFCTSKENAMHVAAAVQRHGRTCAWLTSDNEHEQQRIFDDFDAGRLWAIASVGKITTGANFKRVDFISLLLSSKSAGKIVQILGRGTRLYPGKTDCLVSDHGRNLAHFGPIDQIKPLEPGSGTGEQPKKLCPQDGTDIDGKVGCGELVAISIMTCPCCGYTFPPNEEEKITATADKTPVLSTERPWFEVTGRRFAFHPAKVDGNPPSVKVTYNTDGKTVSEWVCPQHMEHPVEKSRAFPKGKSDRYWATHGGKRPFPATVDEFLDRAGELKATTEVQLNYAKSSKYPDVVAYRVGEGSYVTESEAPAEEPKGNLSALLGRGRSEASAARTAEQERLRQMAREFDEDVIPF
jgi:DNA repair protein RadD